MQKAKKHTYGLVSDLFSWRIWGKHHIEMVVRQYEFVRELWDYKILWIAESSILKFLLIYQDNNTY